jgi:hypothetical protein
MNKTTKIKKNKDLSYILPYLSLKLGRIEFLKV